MPYTQLFLEKKLLYFKSPYLHRGEEIFSKISAVLHDELSNKSELSLFAPLHNLTFEEAETLIHRLNRGEEIENLPAPLLFAIESLRLPKNQRSPKSNRLISGGPFLKGSEYYKIKVSPENMGEVVGMINSNDGHFRLDANQSLSLPQLEKLLTLIDLSKIDYFEEPTADLSAIPFELPLAADESLLRHLNNPKIRRWVIKPTLYGMKKSIELIEMAHQKKIKCTISSTFESELGMQAHYYLANYHNRLHQDPNYHHGLDTLSLMKED